jgi:hypothetical protein
MLGNGNKDDEIREEQRTHQMHQSNLQQAAQQAQDLDTKTYIDKITDHTLDDATIAELSAWLDEDFMHGNLEEAEVHEFRWLARVSKREVEAAHPRQDAVLEGPVRAAVFDDRDRAHTPLSAREKALVHQFIQAVTARATRGRGGWQQEEYNKTITASETREIDSDDDGGFMS